MVINLHLLQVLLLKLFMVINLHLLQVLLLKLFEHAKGQVAGSCEHRK